MRKKFVFSLFAIMLVSLVAMSLATRERAYASSSLYYFVNCGEESVTDAELEYNLIGSLGNGDKAYSEGWGYTSGGTVGGTSGTVFSNWRSGDLAYKFSLEEGSYQVALGIGSAQGGTVKIGGQQKDSGLDISQNTVKSYSVTVSSGEVVIETSGLNLCFIAIADEGAKVLLYAHSPEAEALVYGAVVNSTARGYYSDGTEEDIPINYVNLNASDLNKNFSMIEARGTIRGTSVQVKRYLFTVPDNLLYWVNAGSNKVTTGNNLLDVYYPINEAIFEKFSDTLINDVPDQLYVDGAWGYRSYTSEYMTSSLQMPEKAGDPYPPPFPFNTVRCISGSPYGITYMFTLPQGKKYDLYLGTRSHWHPRNATVTINGDNMGTVSVDGVNRITLYSDISPDSYGKIEISVIGPAYLDEGMISFIAIREHSEAAPIPPKLTVPEMIDMGQTSFEVSGVVKGTKIQVSVADRTNAVIHEEMAGSDGALTVNLPSDRLVGVFKLNVIAVSSGGASEPASVFITDITEFEVTPSTTDWTTGDVILNISAAASSKLTSLVVTYNYIPETIELGGQKNWQGTYAVKENGEYEIKINSEYAYISKTITINNIDKAPVSISLSVEWGNLSEGKIPVKPSVQSQADVVKFEVFKLGEKVGSFTSVPSSFMAAPGIYTFKVTTASGKMAARTLQVSAIPQSFSITSRSTTSGLRVGVEGEGIARVYAYQFLEDSVDRLSVAGTEFNVYQSGKYAIAVEYLSGTVEMTLVDFEISTSEEKGSDNTLLYVLIAAGAVVVAGGGTAVAVAARKKAAK